MASTIGGNIKENNPNPKYLASSHYRAFGQNYTMGHHYEPINLASTPKYSFEWRMIMKWPSSIIAQRPMDRDDLLESDADTRKMVYLVVRMPGTQSPFPPRPPPINPADLHWSICWPITDNNGHHYERIIRIERAAASLDHLTNWGPLTAMHHTASENSSLRIPIARLSLRRRRILERIALTQPVLDPDRIWNSQNWTEELLTRATLTEYDARRKFVHAPIITVQQKAYVLTVVHTTLN